MTPSFSPPKKIPLRGSVHTRVGLIVGATIAVLLITLTLTSTYLIDRMFGGLQDRLTEQRVVRVAEALDQAASTKISHVRDSAEWDETYTFITEGDAEYLPRNFSPESDSSEQDVVLAFNRNRELVGAVQPKNEDDPYSVPKGMDLETLARSPVFKDGKPGAGLVVTQDGIMLVAAAPVLHSSREGPEVGWLLFGTYLDKERLSELASVSGADDLWIARDDGSSPPANWTSVDIANFDLGTANGFYSQALNWTSGDSVDNAFLVVRSLPAPALRFEFPVNLAVFQQATTAKRWIVIVSILCAMVTSLAGWLAIEANVLTPLAQLDREMAGMSESDRPEGRLEARRDDEIGRLANSANHLLDRVMAGRTDAENQRALLDSILDSAREGVEAFRAVRSRSGKVEDLEIVVANRAAERICQLRREELVGGRMNRTFPKLKAAGVFDRCVEVIESRIPATFELYYEGHRITAWLRFSVAPWGDGVVMTFEDVSDRKARERDLAETFSEVERFNAAMVGREERIIHMKREVNELRARLGEPPAYKSVEYDA